MGDEDRRVTRAQAASSSTWGQFLGLTNPPYGRDARRLRSPNSSPATSPIPPTSPLATSQQQVFFPSPDNSRPLPTVENNNDNMGDAALQSLSTALSGLTVSSRKPDLPAFDKTAIEIWIRRVESAYIRAGITSALEKFAFIESKFAVNEDPVVDKFLFGDPTDAQWTEFCNYLKKRHGKTTRQKVAAVLEPAQMDGRTPMQYLARLQQNTDGITIDDIYKEICMRQLPNDIQHVICKATETMNVTDMMTYAESFYNPDGSRLMKKPASVNVVENAANASSNSFTTPYFDNNGDEASGGDINAIRGRQNFQKNRPYNNNNNFARSKSRGRSFGGGGAPSGGNNGYNNAPRSNNNNNKPQDPTLCFYHNQFGDRAKKCDIGCAKQKSGNGPSPRQ